MSLSSGEERGPCGRYTRSVLVFFLILFVGVNIQSAETWPDGLSFVGLAEGRWRLYIVFPGGSQPQVAATALEPRTPTYNPRTGRVAYIDVDGSVREIVLEQVTERVLLYADGQHTFTQPAYDAEGKRLFVVVLKDRESVETDIVAVDGDRSHPVVTQRSAQFEPYVHATGQIYYSNVICTLGCGKIIQELWRMHLVSGEAEQLTLLNAIARQPVVSQDGQWLYFSSNKGGNFHLWRLALETGQYEQLTTGRVTDSSPALTQDGQVYFIRHAPTGTYLMRRGADGAIQPLSLPDTVQDLRDLEIHR